jgi:flagellar biogenesis protein FliO
VAANFVTHYLVALATVALILGGLYAFGRYARRRGFALPFAGRLPPKVRIAIVGTAMVAPQAYVHVVKAGDRHLLIGATPASVTLLGEMTRGLRQGAETGDHSGFEVDVQMAMVEPHAGVVGHHVGD